MVHRYWFVVRIDEKFSLFLCVSSSLVNSIGVTASIRAIKITALPKDVATTPENLNANPEHWNREHVEHVLLLVPEKANPEIIPREHRFNLHTSTPLTFARACARWGHGAMHIMTGVICLKHFVALFNSSA